MMADFGIRVRNRIALLRPPRNGRFTAAGGREIIDPPARVGSLRGAA
jgi:hypothetical protein